MIGRRLVILSASAALHLGGAGLVLMAAGAGAGSAILIDLVSDVTGGARPTSPAERTSSRPGPSIAGGSPRVRAPGSPRVSVPERAPAPSDQPAGDEARTPGAPPRSAGLSPSAVPAPSVEPSRSVVPSPSAAPAPSVEPSRTAVPSPGPVAPVPAPAAALLAPGQAMVAQADAARGEGGGTSSRLTSPHGIAASSAAAAGGATGPPGPGKGSGAVSGAGDAGSAMALAAAGEGRGGPPPEYGPYLHRFRRRVAEALHYPLAARRQGLAGRVEIEVLLEPSGRVAEARVVASSSHAVLDEAALAAVKRLIAEPFPDRLPRRPLRIRLPLAFELE